ncbi:MAG: class I SAM-dependent methyltransferase [Candidatus Heimdallarchaeota archaeon]
MNNREDPTAKNNERWDLLADIHVKAAEDGTAGIYDLKALRAGESSLFPIERSELPDLNGKRVLHLQCHFGMDSVSIARTGAEVVGVDFSANAIVAASKIARELKVNASFIQCDIYKLIDTIPDEMETFDFVFTSHGALCWLSDIKAWGQIIAFFLKPGGQFYVIDSHPFSYIFDNEEETMDFKLRTPYFNDGKAFRYESEGSYIDENITNNPSIAKTVSYEWYHTLSEIVMALIDAGLSIEFLHEHAEASWQAFKYAKRVENDLWVIDQDGLNIHLSFSILAKKSL